MIYVGSKNSWSNILFYLNKLDFLALLLETMFTRFHLFGILKFEENIFIYIPHI